MGGGVTVSVNFNTYKVISTMRSTAGSRVFSAASEVRNIALQKLSGSRKGKIYRVPGTRKEYVASAPGEPPAQATGRLRQSVKIEVENIDRSLVGRVGTDLDYGRMLEFGTMKMLPRPWLGISFNEAKPEIEKILGEEWF